MKINNFIILLCIMPLFQCCNVTNTQNDKRKTENNQQCSEIGEKANKLILTYTILNDSTFDRLDSAMILIDSIMPDCPQFYAGLSTSKLKIFSLKKEFSEAMDFTRTLDVKGIFPQSKSILLKRFAAMQYEYKGNSISRDSLINNIIVELKDSLSGTNTDSVLRLPNCNDILNNKVGFKLIQYYYYRSRTEGSSKIFDELDCLEKDINGNSVFFDLLKSTLEDSLMIYNGL